MTKPSSAQASALNQIMAQGGAVLSSAWTTGTGRYTKCRALPPYCDRIGFEDVEKLRGAVKSSAEKLFRKYPRARTLVVVKDLRSANRLIQEAAQAAGLGVSDGTFKYFVKGD